MLDALGNIGDFLGGIGVFATLIYLAVQIRNNTISSRTASYQAAITSISEIARELALNAEAMDIFTRGQRDRASLPPAERTRFDVLVLSMMRNYENIHFQYAQGAIPDELWEGWARRVHSTFDTPGVQDWWRNQRLGFGAGFRAFVESAEPGASGVTPFSHVD